jgi:carbonic anhydrase
MAWIVIIIVSLLDRRQTVAGRGLIVGASRRQTLYRLAPRDTAYYTYMGSVTAPPCAEGVTWVCAEDSSGDLGGADRGVR